MISGSLAFSTWSHRHRSIHVFEFVIDCYTLLFKPCSASSSLAFYHGFYYYFFAFCCFFLNMHQLLIGNNNYNKNNISAGLQSQFIEIENIANIKVSRPTDIDIFMTIQTNLLNKDRVFYTDSNCFQVIIIMVFFLQFNEFRDTCYIFCDY